MPYPGSLADLRGGLYGRVSVDRHPGRSVDDQLNVGRAWAARAGVKAAKEYRDDGISASSYARGKARPDWQRAMVDINAGRLDVLWVWELSRATRDREVWAALIKACQQRACLLAVDSTVYDTNDPDDAFMLDLLLGMAVRESAVTHKRVMRGVQSSLAAGRPRGKIPYGYTRTYDPTTGAIVTQVPDPVTAPIVRELFARVAAGEGLYSIGKDFNARGLPTPQQSRDERRGVDAVHRGWSGSKIRRQLGNPALAGYSVHKGVIQGDGNWEPLVPADTFDRVNKILADPARRSQRGVEVKFLLSGILECGICGASCRRTVNRGRPNYACQGQDYNNRACVAGRQEPIEEYVQLAVVQHFSDPDILEMLAELSDPGEQDEAIAEMTALSRRLEEFQKAALRPDGPSPEFVARMQAEYLPKIADAKARAIPVWVPEEVKALAYGNAEKLWPEMSLTSQRTVIRSQWRIVLHKDDRPRGSRGFNRSRLQVELR